MRSSSRSSRKEKKLTPEQRQRRLKYRRCPEHNCLLIPVSRYYGNYVVCQCNHRDEMKGRGCDFRVWWWFANAKDHDGKFVGEFAEVQTFVLPVSLPSAGMEVKL